MTIAELQARVAANALPASGTEIMLALTEEIGEVAQEVALLERVGSKAHWQKAGSTERLGTEISHALNCLLALANRFEITLEAVPYFDTPT